MAEGGEDPNDNPFSFHNFNKKKAKSPSDTLAGTSSDEREDVYDMPDVQNIGVSDDDRNRRPPTADGGWCLLQNLISCHSVIC